MKIHQQIEMSQSNRDELVEEWGKHFEELLNNSNDPVDTSNIPEASQDLNIKISNFTKEELIIAIKSMKNDKSPGSDEAITADMVAILYILQFLK